MTEHLEYETNLLLKQLKPVVIQEFCAFIRWCLETWKEGNKQAAYQKKCKRTSRKNYSFMSWTLYDFPHVPDRCGKVALAKTGKQIGLLMIKDTTTRI
jgi:hypothetical protein